MRDLPSLQVGRAEVEIEFGLRKCVEDDIVGNGRITVDDARPRKSG